MATLKDVAFLAQVHPSTVSRVLRCSENLPISAETRQRIMAAAIELDYHPDQRARALRLGKSNTIGLIIPDISNPFFADIAQSIEQECHKAGYMLMVCVSNEDQEKEINFVNNLTSRGIDGLIIAPVQDSYAHLVRLKKKNYPFVLIDRCFEEFETNAVISDNEASAFDAMEHLVKLGHRRIAFLSGRPTIYTIRKRLAGYLHAVNVYDLDRTPELISNGGFTFEQGYKECLKILSLPEPPSALLVSGNQITFGALRAIVETGLKIPEDISLIGFTDSIVTPFLVSPLTAITHPLRDMGARAFALLLQHMNAKERLPFSRIVVETKMLPGASTAPINEKMIA
ncbi:LacI family DNA-binding transcriptional regulator [candidate division KSB1 bacterium]|nr:LacI family DNA-binding transcriptional regulator [candidate division KSB1 bacterium]RQW03526.1 MAG: LacI family transcriptional regulator [candidate division KSB1 bacterium]